MKTLELVEHALNRIQSNYFLDNLFRQSRHFFTYTGDSFFQVKGKVTSAINHPVEITTYKSKWPWSKSRGAFRFNKKKGQYEIIINIRWGWDLDKMVGFLVHELSHQASYKHGGNSVHWYNKKKKMNSVPYSLGNLAKRISGEY